MIANCWQLETPTDGVWKFVRVDGQYRWLTNSYNHSDAVDHNNEEAEAAGTVFVFEDQKLAKMEGAWSMSLRVSTDSEAYRHLRNAFNAIGYRWEEL